MRAMFLLLLTPAPALAQDEVVVLGAPLKAPPGIPAFGATTIARDRLTGDASGRVEDVLLDAAGVQQFRRSDSRSANPSAQGLTLRGLGGNATSRALVLLDGVPIADPFFGFIPFNALIADQLGSVRVTRGAGAGGFGAGAVAGVIELASTRPADLPALAVSADYGSFNAERVEAGARAGLGAGVVTLGGRWERADGFFTTPPDQLVPASARAAYADWTLNARAVIALAPATELQARIALFDDRRTLRFQGADSFALGEDASVRLVHRGSWQVEAIAYLQARDFGNRVISATRFRLTLDQRATPSSGYGGKIELRPPIGGEHVLRIGVDARVGEGIAFEDAYSVTTGLVTARRSAGGRTAIIGGFVEDDWTIGRLVLTGGARVDRWSITGGFARELNAGGAINSDASFADRAGTEASGRFGLLWRATPVIALRAAAYAAFRLPTPNELYRSFVVVPVTTLANASLAPERLRGGEIGVDITLPHLSLAITGFDNRLSGAIGNVTIGANLRQRQNLGAIEARGVELSGRLTAGRWSLTASYAYTDSRVSQPGPLNGLRPAQSPQHSVSATLGWQSPRGFIASATLRHIGSQFEDDLQTDVLPAVTTLDGTIRLPISKNAALMLRGENLFDARVVTRNAGGSIDLGTPRTLWIGVRLNR